MTGPPATCCRLCYTLATRPTVRPTDPPAPLLHAPLVGWGEHHPGGPTGPPGGAALHPEPERHAAVAPRHRPCALQLILTPLSYTVGNLTTVQERAHPDTWVPAIPAGRRVLGVGHGKGSRLRGGFQGTGLWSGGRSQGVRDVV
ncbi:unnamed protein product [Caretta caretta]